MIWGVGTGRCGTKSLARDLGGTHEPKPWLGEDAILAHRGDEQARERTALLLIGRLEADTPCVDLKHSWLIPDILRIDPAAQFVWVIRQPVACVHSLLAGGSWTERDWHGTKKWYPAAGWPAWYSRFMKACDYWAEVNRMIWLQAQAQPKRFRQVRTEDLQAHQNKYPPRIRYEFSHVERLDLETLDVLYRAMTPSAQSRAKAS